MISVGGCSAERKAEGPPPEAVHAPTELTAVLAGANHIELRWKDNAANEAGYFVEYTSDPDDPFVLLNAVPRNATMALHPDLAPDTRFIYRVIPFFGEASNVAEVTTGKVTGATPPPAETAEPEPGPSGDKSLRTTAAEAAPAALTAHLLAPTRVGLEWKDRSSDEDGYLVEGTAGIDDFRVFAYVEPNVTSYTVDDLPAQKKCYFRVRAFYRGTPSASADQTTAKDPSAASSSR